MTQDSTIWTSALSGEPTEAERLPLAELRIEDGRDEHVGAFFPQLRVPDWRALDPNTVPSIFMRMWLLAAVRRVALIRDSVVGAWGCNDAEEAGAVWLFPGPGGEPIAEPIARHIREDFAAWLQRWPGLEIDVSAGPVHAVQFFLDSGFAVVGETTDQGKSFLKMRLSRECQSEVRRN